MSDAKKCDRCGEFYTLDISDEKDDVAGIALLDRYGRYGQKLDFCQKCRKDFMEWINGDEVFMVCATCAHYNKPVDEVREVCGNCINKSNWEPEREEESDG